MATKLEEITATFRHERIRWDTTAILDCEGKVNGSGLIDDITVKVVDSEPDELTPYLTYRFYGRWTKHPRHGRQFVAKTFIKMQPHGPAGTMRYLGQAPGVGQRTAKALWDAFGGEAVRILREHPDVAAAKADVQGFTTSKAKAAAAYLENERALEGCTIDMIDLLGGRGFRKTTAKRAIALFGNRAAELIRRNPYLLQKFPGSGFMRPDKMFLEFGGDPTRLKRQAYCMAYAVQSNTDGHTWHGMRDVEGGLRKFVGGSKVLPVKAAKLAIRGKLLAVRRDAQNRPWLADATKAENEQYIADAVASMRQDAPHWPSVASLDVSDHQREELFNALTGTLSIFGGGPGTGKTYSLARVIGKVIDRHGDGAVTIAAPTGKAAVRITEVMQGYGVNQRAMTIHGLLGVEQQSEGGVWSFRHDEANPLDQSYLFIDESSMIDTDLMASLLRACAPGTHLLLVGDTNQLPPVGHGAPLRDLIKAGVPYGELTEIRRNSGSIVTACHKIRANQKFQADATLDLKAGQNLANRRATSPQKAVASVLDLLQRIKSNGSDTDPVWDCQILCAVNRNAELSRGKLNEVLQGELNPAGKRAPGNPFRVGDKVVNTKNGFFPIDDDAPQDANKDALDGKVFVANGELGRVVGVQEKLTTVSLDSPKRLIKIPRGKGGDDGEEGEDKKAPATGCSWDLGYALSVHKSQGSEWSVIIVMLDESPGARMVCSREWIYTAISRAKKVCFLVGKMTTAHDMLGRVALGRRKTFLVEQLQQQTKG